MKVLDKGFVKLVDSMGCDKDIVAAARVSYAGKGKKKDTELIKYLWENGHTSPFEQVVFKFHIKMPIFIARQWIRHRTARLNEISGRYSVLSEEFYVPEKIRTQDEKNKQGSSVEFPEPASKEIIDEMRKFQEEAYKHYKRLIDLGVSREMARINLPLSLYTEMIWQMDLHNLFHFIKLRIHHHAQPEIQEYAKALLYYVEKKVPIAAAIFKGEF